MPSHDARTWLIRDDAPDTPDMDQMEEEDDAKYDEDDERDGTEKAIPMHM